MNALIRPSFRQVSPERFESLAVPIRLLHSALAQALRLASLEQLLGRPLPRRWRDEACPLEKRCLPHCMGFVGRTLSWDCLAAFRLTPACFGLMPRCE